MKLHYDPATDSLYIELNPAPSVESDEIRDGVVLDYDDKKNLVGIDLQHASEHFDLNNIEINTLMGLKKSA